MHVQGIGNEQAPVIQQSQQQGSLENNGTMVDMKGMILARVETRTSIQVRHSTGMAHGPVGPAQANSFLGIADVRLQVGFYGQVHHFEAQPTLEALETGSQELVTALDAKVWGLSSRFHFAGQADDLMDRFGGAVDGLFHSSEEGPFTFAPILDGIRDAFASLFDSLTRFAPIPVDPTTDTPGMGEAIAAEENGNGEEESEVAPAVVGNEEDESANTALLPENEAVNAAELSMSHEEQPAVATDISRIDEDGVSGLSPLAGNEATIEESVAANTAPPVANAVKPNTDEEIAGTEEPSPGSDGTVAQANSVLAEQPAVTSSGTPAGESEPEPEYAAFTNALQGLQEWFDAEMATLERRVTELLNQPFFNEPFSNGLANSRVLEMYNDLAHTRDNHEGRSSRHAETLEAQA